MKGNDLLNGLQRDDCLFGGVGSARLSGGKDDDRLLGDDTGGASEATISVPATAVRTCCWAGREGTASTAAVATTASPAGADVTDYVEVPETIG